jgi:hypothetical protein
MKIIKSISTHKAVKDGKEIKIYLKGMSIDEVAPDGTKLWEEGSLEKYPDWFKDELLYTIPVEDEDDVFAIMERYEEDNRCNVAELNGEF